MKLVRKKRVAEVDASTLREFELTVDQRRIFAEGVELFNRGKFWEAHEAWEHIWREREEESRIFFQGIIQAAAAFHLVFENPRPAGARNNCEKALAILEVFPVRFLGIDVDELRGSLRELSRIDLSKTSGALKGLTPRMSAL
ncbi:MAG: hypothetical protein HW374_150 [Bacteroidetes bacterium]|nr:hypothetical protein [Bacteroidota bacterium]